MKQWNVRVHRDGQAVVIGQVCERNEALARCAALSIYGVSDDEVASGEVSATNRVLLPDDAFDVSPAT